MPYLSISAFILLFFLSLSPPISESAEFVGQVLTLPRWMQIVLARIKGLRAAQEVGERPF